MNVQLYLSDQLMELDETVNFPLTKTFDDINNPTSIITEYSKTVNIPMTKHNNEIFGNIYRLDRLIKVNGNDTIGMYFDPSKKIPFKLLYNGDLLLEGYAKFMEASYSVSNKYYSITLYSSLGSIFKKLREVVVNEIQLSDDQRAESDGGAKYVLDDLLSGDKLDASKVIESWQYNQKYTSLFDESGNVASGIKDCNIIGFLPSYRGYYSNNWSSDKAEWTNPETGVREIVQLSDVINYNWKQTYKTHHPSATDDEVNSYVEGLDAEGLIEDGLTEYQLNSYRSYEQRPYIIFSALMQLYQKKCKELTGYDMVLDTDFFNSNNPYYYKTCYTLDFLGTSSDNTTSEVISEGSTYNYGYSTTYPDLQANNYIGIQTLNLDVQIDNDYNDGIVIIDPINLTFVKKYVEESNNTTRPKGTLQQSDIVAFPVTVSLMNYSNGTYSAASSKKFWIYGGNSWGYYFSRGAFGYSPDDRIIDMSNDFSYKTKINISGGPTSMELTLSGTATIPRFVLSGATSNNIRIRIEIGCQYQSGPYVYDDGTKTNLPINSSSPNTDYVLIKDISYQTKWRNNLKMKMSTFYQGTDPLFDVILQYTKMFGLVWDIDDVENKIYIKTRNNYFKNYTIKDWSNKVDRNNDVSIEPVSFDVRFVSFGYEELDGYNLSQYYDENGEVYGAKRINTGYEFNRDETKMIESLYPTCCSNRSFLTFDTILNWDLESVLLPTLDSYTRMDCDNEDGDDSECKSNWVFKEGITYISNSSSRPYITDDSELQLSEDEYCYIYKEGSQSMYMPEFNIATRVVDNSSGISKLYYYGILMNTPLTDYTRLKYPTRALGNYIYDNFWSNYINERYNIQNKKVTMYLNITPIDYMEFKFNKFILINNQLFMINKIIDYDPTVKQTTKCELIQITDPEVYSTGQNLGVWNSD